MSARSGKIPRLRIRQVYYPRIPDFRERRAFLEATLTMNLRLFGDETGVMAYNLLKAIQRINSADFSHRSLSKGDVIDVNGSLFHILWPPHEILPKTLARIGRALKDFYIAVEEDEEMRFLYDYVIEEGLFREYLEEGRKEPTEHQLETLERQRKLPEVVDRANKSLRRAANDLSLALLEDNRFLFLGDLESHELSKIVEDLDSRTRKRFYVLITPHHGTHWTSRLSEIQCIYSLSSVGRNLVSKMESGFKTISEVPLATYVNGDIRVPMFERLPSPKTIGIQLVSPSDSLARLVNGLTDRQEKYLRILLSADDWLCNRVIRQEFARRGYPDMVSRSISGVRSGLTRKADNLGLESLDESDWDRANWEKRYRIRDQYRTRLAQLLSRDESMSLFDFC